MTEERGCHMTELKERGCQMTELEERGCHMTEERECHMTEESECQMTELKERGCHMTELEERGYHMTELEERGCHMRGKRVEHQQMTDGCIDQFMNLAKMGRKTWRKYFGIEPGPRQSFKPTSTSWREQQAQRVRLPKPFDLPERQSKLDLESHWK